MNEKKINEMIKMQKQATSRKRGANRYSPISMEHTGVPGQNKRWKARKGVARYNHKLQTKFVKCISKTSNMANTSIKYHTETTKYQAEN